MSIRTNTAYDLYIPVKSLQFFIYLSPSALNCRWYLLNYVTIQRSIFHSIFPFAIVCYSVLRAKIGVSIMNIDLYIL